MNLFAEAIASILSGPVSETVGQRLTQHLFLTLLSVAIAAAIAIPLGWLIGHTGRGRELAVGLSGAARALPTLGLLFFVALLAGRSLAVGLLVFVVLAIPPILAGAYSGLEAVDRRTVDAGRAMGMTEWQILMKVEVPLGLPLLLGGIRSAALQVVATATLAAFIGLGGLGGYIQAGLALRDFPQMLAGALLVTALALVLEGVFALLQHLAVPRGVAASRT
ncbi:ABC transporter permease [Herbiconiux sp. SYSU D00978]|uniref:ABC transporter permease n=1 Tax=Herbiconiux sp. SYSU D00978 TaxID=2812562 RepID=UPI001A9604D7|nr:ABC transporter permease subunit [Herbiconiux sp. SYSU D00978]